MINQTVIVVDERGNRLDQLENMTISGITIRRKTLYGNVTIGKSSVKAVYNELNDTWVVLHRLIQS